MGSLVAMSESLVLYADNRPGRPAARMVEMVITRQAHCQDPPGLPAYIVSRETVQFPRIAVDPIRSHLPGRFPGRVKVLAFRVEIEGAWRLFGRRLANRVQFAVPGVDLRLGVAYRIRPATVDTNRDRLLTRQVSRHRFHEPMH